LPERNAAMPIPGPVTREEAWYLRRRAVSAGQAFLRRLFDPIDLLFSLGVVALVVAGTNPQWQRVGDLVGKTRVIGDPADDTRDA
jgi:uncharacterized RDD family membrane protein YckC